MVTMNVETDLDVANGSRGIVTGIILDENEPITTGTRIVKLKNPPACIMVKLDHGERIHLQGLEAKTVPIFPTTQVIRISKRKDENKGFQVTRKQFCLTPAYAFTDYRAQGQTLEKVIVDIYPPPTGPPLTNFNIYVALSRSRGQQGIRLLRTYDRNALLKQIPDYLANEDVELRVKDANTTVL